MRKIFLFAIFCMVPVVIIFSTIPVLAQAFTILTPISATAEVNPDDAPKTIDNNPDEMLAPTYWLAQGESECIKFDMGIVVEGVVGFRETSAYFPGNPFLAFVSTDDISYELVVSDNLTQGDFGIHLFEAKNVRFFYICVQETGSQGFGELADFRALLPLPIVPDIKANGSDGPLNISRFNNLSITVELDPDYVDENADWWVLADTPMGWYHYVLPSGWAPGQNVTHQGPLFDLPSHEVLNMSGLPIGSYTFYFGVDMDMNGLLDIDQIYYDSVDVSIAWY